MREAWSAVFTSPSNCKLFAVALELGLSEASRLELGFKLKLQPNLQQGPRLKMKAGPWPGPQARLRKMAWARG